MKWVSTIGNKYSNFLLTLFSNFFVILFPFSTQRTLYDKKLACRALQAQEKRILHGMDRYDRGLTPSHSQDSGICSPSSLLCPNQSSLNYSSKSQSMSSLSSGGFSLSMIPGNESLEEISILDIWTKKENRCSRLAESDCHVTYNCRHLWCSFWIRCIWLDEDCQASGEVNTTEVLIGRRVSTKWLPIIIVMKNIQHVEWNKSFVSYTTVIKRWFVYDLKRAKEDQQSKVYYDLEKN